MKRNANLNEGISKTYSHLWSGSIDIHNLSNSDFIKKHPKYVQTIISNLGERKEIDKIRNTILNKMSDLYTTKKNGKRFWNSRAAYEEYEKILNEGYAKYAVKLIDKTTIFTMNQSNAIFNATMVRAGELAKKYEVKYPGFRFAINGGRSFNSRSLSISTWPFLVKNADKSYEEQIENDCLKMFKFFIYQTSLKAREQFTDYKQIC